MYNFGNLDDIQKTARANALSALDAQARIANWQVEQMMNLDTNNRQALDAWRVAVTGGVQLVQDMQRLWVDALAPAPASAEG